MIHYSQLFYDGIPLVVMSSQRSANIRCLDFVAEYFAANPKYVLTTEPELKAYRKACPGFTVVAHPGAGMHAADTFLTTSPIFGPMESRPFVFKLDDDVVASHIVFFAEGKASTKKISISEWKDAWEKMGRALVQFGGFVAGAGGNDPRNSRPELGFRTAMGTLMDVCQIRRRSLALVYPPEQWAKADWAIAMRAYQTGGFLIRCEYIVVKSSHYDIGGLGPLTPARARAEAVASKSLLAEPDTLASSIRQRQGGIMTSINWKRGPEPRVLYDRARCVFFIPEVPHEASSSSEVDAAALLERWLKVGRIDPSKGYRLEEIRVALCALGHLQNDQLSDTSLGLALRDSEHVVRKKTRQCQMYYLRITKARCRRVSN